MIKRAGPSVALPSSISHLLQLLRGECCHLGASLLQSLKLCWAHHCVNGLRTET